MIRINLATGATKPRKGSKRPAVSLSLGSGEGNILMVVVALVAITLVANSLWYLKLTRDRDKINNDLAVAETLNLSLAATKAKYLEREKQKNDYQRRVDVIEQLRSNQAGPVNLLSMIGDTVNKTDAVWLATMKEEGSSISIEGMALSVKAVANLMQNLKRTNYFKSVEIKESFQDNNVKDMQAFVFTLLCEKPGEKPVQKPAPAQSKKS